MKTLSQFVKFHKNNIDDQQRLGQRFFNEFVGHKPQPTTKDDFCGWPELFHERDDKFALEIIRKHLDGLQYKSGNDYLLPPTVDKRREFNRIQMG